MWRGLLFVVLASPSVVIARSFEEDSEAIEVLKGEQGNTVHIPCDLILEDNLVLVWKQQKRILFAGPLRVRQDSRMAVDSGYLRIENVQPSDAGDYSCQVELETGELLVSRKSLVVLQPARAKISPGGGVITIKSGTSLDLSCTGSGVPVPEITWVRDGKVIATGVEQADLSLKEITWQSGGLYQCQASNNVGEINVKNFTIQVLHAPIVEVLPAEVELTSTCRVQIQCLVYSAPRSTVRWFHQGRLLQPGADITMWNLEYLHVLQLNDCAEREGDYTCMAENSLGSNEGVTHLKKEHMVRQVEEVVVRVDRQISVKSGGDRSIYNSLTSLVTVLVLAAVLR